MRAPAFIHQHRFDLAADALLISSGLFSLVAAIGITLMWVTGGFESGSAVDAALSDTWLAGLLSITMMVVGIAVGPALAWRFHGRRLRWLHLLAILGGGAALSVITVAISLIGQALSAVLTPLTGSEFTAPIVLLGLVAVLFLVILWHAVRDAMAPAGDPPALERLRLLSITSLGLLVFVVTGALAIGAGGEMGDALIFAMLIGYSGMATTLAGMLIDQYSER